MMDSIYLHISNAYKHDYFGPDKVTTSKRPLDPRYMIISGVVYLNDDLYCFTN